MSPFCPWQPSTLGLLMGPASFHSRVGHILPHPFHIRHFSTSVDLDLLGYCPSLVSVAGMEIMTKTNLERKGFNWFTGHSPSWRDTRTGAEAETMRKRC